MNEVIDKQVFLRTLVRTVVDRVLRVDKLDSGVPEAILDRLPTEEARDEFRRRDSMYIFDSSFEWFHGEKCLLIELNWRDFGFALDQLTRLGFGSLDAVKIARRGPFVQREMTEQDHEVCVALMNCKMAVPEQAEKRKRSRGEDADLSVSQVAKLLQVSRTSVMALISSGKLKGYSAAAPGAKRNSWRVSQADLDSFRSGEQGKASKEKSEKPVQRRKRLPPVKKYV